MTHSLNEHVSGKNTTLRIRKIDIKISKQKVDSLNREILNLNKKNKALQSQIDKLNKERSVCENLENFDSTIVKVIQDEFEKVRKSTIPSVKSLTDSLINLTSENSVCLSENSDLRDEIEELRDNNQLSCCGNLGLKIEENSRQIKANIKQGFNNITLKKKERKEDEEKEKEKEKEK